MAHEVEQGIGRLADALRACDSVVVGAGAGLSAAAGLTYTGWRFERYFGDFARRYGFRDMYAGGFFPYETPEERWVFWSRYIWINRYAPIPGRTYERLRGLVRSREHFVITTNVDHCFQRAGFDKQRLFYTQGDYGLFQCSQPCCAETWDNREAVRAMVEAQGFTVAPDGALLLPGEAPEPETVGKAGGGVVLGKGETSASGLTILQLPEAQRPAMRVPSDLVPTCPRCGRSAAMNLRADATFAEDAGWHQAAARYNSFLQEQVGSGRRVLFLELGIGGNTPVIIKYPFWRMTMADERATYACVNLGEAGAPSQIQDRSICVDADIDEVLAALKGMLPTDGEA